MNSLHPFQNVEHEVRTKFFAQTKIVAEEQEVGWAQIPVCGGFARPLARARATAFIFSPLFRGLPEPK
jgi:hypothetical protein